MVQCSIHILSNICQQSQTTVSWSLQEEEDQGMKLPSYIKKLASYLPLINKQIHTLKSVLLPCY